MEGRGHAQLLVTTHICVLIPDQVSRVYPKDCGSIQKHMGLFRNGVSLSRSGVNTLKPPSSVNRDRTYLVALYDVGEKQYRG